MTSKAFRSNVVRLSLIFVAVVILALSLFITFGKSASSNLVRADAPLVASFESGSEASIGDAQTVVLDQVPQAASSTQLQPQQVRLHTGISAEELLALKQQASSHGVTPINGPLSAPEMTSEGAPLTPSAFVNFAGMSEAGWVPSDMALAVGQTYIVQVVNESIAVYTKAGVIQAGYPKSLQAFLCGGCGNSVFDPRAFYDWQNNRYVVLADQDNGFASSTFYIAASQTPNPLGAWWIFAFTYGGTDDFGDFPTLGFDAEGIYTCESTFSNSSGSFVGNKCFLIPKAKVYAGAGFSYYYFTGFNVGGTLVDSIQPVKTLETNKPRAEFMVNSFNILWGGGQCYLGCSGLVVWAISNPFGFASGGPAPTVSGWVVSTSTYVLPPDADAPGCPGCVATNDTRISAQPTYAAGSIWTAVVTGVDSPAVPGVLWWEIGVSLDDNGGGCTGRFLNLCPILNNAYLKQEGIYWYSGSAAYFPAIQPDAENNVMMTIAYSNSTTPPSVVYAGRRIDQTLNNFHDGGIFLVVGSGSMNTGNRWGDYFATGIDQTAKPWKMWIAGQVNTGLNFWGTRIGEIDYRAKNAP